MAILYKILSILLNTVALFLAISIVMSIPILLASPLNMLSAFMLLSIVLYAWFSNKFLKTVLIKQEPVKASLKDWIKVNGVVSLIYSLFIILGMVAFIANPDVILSQMKEMGVEVPAKSITVLLYILLAFGIVLFVHVVWTFVLMRRNIAFFKS